MILNTQIYSNKFLNGYEKKMVKYGSLNFQKELIGLRANTPSVGKNVLLEIRSLKK